MAKFFISYRRSDTSGITGRIYDRFVERYGVDAVFMDVDTIPPGLDFRDQLTEWISTSDVLLVVIGHNWLGGDEGRLNDPADFVRIELEIALERNIPVVPVLVDGASMPGAEQLPEALEALAFRNAVTLSSGRDFHEQINRLFQDLERLPGVGKGTKSALPGGEVISHGLPNLVSIVEFFTDGFSILFQVLSSGADYFDTIDHASKPELYRAIRFAAFMSLAGLLVLYPIYVLAGIEISIGFLILDTIVTVMMLFLLGFMLHLGALLVRGTGSVNSSIVAAISVSCILYISNLLLLIFPELSRDVVVDGMDGARNYGVTEPEKQTAYEDPRALMIVTLSMVVLGFWLFVNTTTFKKLHALSTTRTVVFCILSLLFLGVYTLIGGGVQDGIRASFTAGS